MKPFALIAALALSAGPAAAQPSRDGELHAFLQERFADERTDYPETRYAHGWADLDADGRPEALVYMMSGAYCGSGGCNLFIYTPEQSSFYQRARTTVVNPPVRVLGSRRGGFRDIAVAVSGGGMRSRTVILRQNGGTYPDNASVAPTLRRVPAGQTVITTNDRGRRLF